MSLIVVQGRSIGIEDFKERFGKNFQRLSSKTDGGNSVKKRYAKTVSAGNVAAEIVIGDFRPWSGAARRIEAAFAGGGGKGPAQSGAEGAAGKDSVGEIDMRYLDGLNCHSQRRPG